MLKVTPSPDAVDIEGLEAHSVNVDLFGSPCHAHIETLVGLHAELLCCRVHEKDILACLVQNDDAFFQVVEDLVVADAHDF